MRALYADQLLPDLRSAAGWTIRGSVRRPISPRVGTAGGFELATEQRGESVVVIERGLAAAWPLLSFGLTTVVAGLGLAWILRVVLGIAWELLGWYVLPIVLLGLCFVGWGVWKPERELVVHRAAGVALVRSRRRLLPWQEEIAPHPGVIAVGELMRVGVGVVRPPTNAVYWWSGSRCLLLGCYASLEDANNAAERWMQRLFVDDVCVWAAVRCPLYWGVRREAWKFG